MAWKLFGHATTPAQLPAELRSILAQMQRERVAFEALTAGARDATQQLTQLTQPIAEAQKVVAELQGRVKALERLVPVLATLDEQTEGVSRTQRRTETQVEHTAEDVKTLRTEIEQLRATLDAALALKALADYVTQKVAVLEQQREAVDRALGKATQLDDVMRDIDAKIRTHEANAKSLGALETRVTDLQALHGDLLARSREVSVRHDQIAQADQELHGRLNGLRDEVQRTVKRFELENQGLDAVGQRILDLRGSLTDMETRCRTLDESSRTIGDVRSQADGLTKQLGSLSETVAHLETQTEHLGAVQGDAERLAQTVEQMTQRVAPPARRAAEHPANRPHRDRGTARRAYRRAGGSYEHHRPAVSGPHGPRRGGGAHRETGAHGGGNGGASGTPHDADRHRGDDAGRPCPEPRAARRTDQGAGAGAAGAAGRAQLRHRAFGACLTAAGGGGQYRAAVGRARRSAHRSPHRRDRSHRGAHDDPRGSRESRRQLALRA